MKVTRYTILILLTCLQTVLFCDYAFAQSSKNKVATIVLDPGHGGKHPGTVYKGIMEKDITLSVALKLGKLINDNFSDVKVIYTRTTDKYVDLVDRGKMANSAGADLFLSIHVDAVNGPTANGSSSWVMGIDKSDKNLDVAMRENDVVSYEEDYTTKYEGYVPGSTESFIIFTLMQYANTDQSMMFASTIQKHYRQNTPIVDRGARQGPYLVLWRTAMPSVLTEIGFLSNASDRKFVTSQAGQNRIAKALFNAFSEYKAKVEGKSSPLQLALDESDNESGNAVPIAPTANNSDTVEAVPQQKTASTDNKKQKITFCVQVASSPKKISTNSSTFKAYRGKVTERKIGTLYKYYVGSVNTYKEAMDLQRKVRGSIQDAFVVAFQGDKSISVSEARKIVEK